MNNDNRSFGMLDRIEAMAIALVAITLPVLTLGVML